MEGWLTALIIAVILMAAALSLLPHLERRARGRKPGRAGKPGPGPGAGGPENYGLAPKNPDVMAGALFELLSLKLNFKEITAFADLVISEEMTARYLDRLITRSSLAKFARNLAYLCNSMKFNGFTPEDRARVAEALRVKARKEYKLLEIQKNLDNIF